MRRSFLVLFGFLLFGKVWANHWDPEHYQFADNMNVVGIIEVNGVEQASPYLELGAFCGEECRGSEMLTYYDGPNRYMVFLTLHGENGHVFNFKLYDHASQQELNFGCDQSIQFVANDVVGTVVAPFMFSFFGIEFQIEAVAQPASAGTVEGMGTYYEGAMCTLVATANASYSFINWSENGVTVSTDSIYSFVVEQDRNLVATFAQSCFVINAVADPLEGGTIEGTGNYIDGTQCNLIAHPATGFDFVKWTEDDEVVSFEANYAFLVSEDRNLVAHFTPIQFVVTTSTVPSYGGMVEGGGMYYYGDIVTLVAYPANDYVFQKWTENNDFVSSDPTLSFMAYSDRHLVAHFINYDGFAEAVMEVEAFPNPTDGMVRLNGLSQGLVLLSNASGLLLQQFELTSDNQQFDLTRFPAGIYVLQIKTHSGKIVNKVLKR